MNIERKLTGVSMLLKNPKFAIKICIVQLFWEREKYAFMDFNQNNMTQLEKSTKCARQRSRGTSNDCSFSVLNVKYWIYLSQELSLRQISQGKTGTESTIAKQNRNQLSFSTNIPQVKRHWKQDSEAEMLRLPVALLTLMVLCPHVTQTAAPKHHATKNSREPSWNLEPPIFHITILKTTCGPDFCFFPDKYKSLATKVDLQRLVKALDALEEDIESLEEALEEAESDLETSNSERNAQANEVKSHLLLPGYPIGSEWSFHATETESISMECADQFTVLILVVESN